VSKFDKIISSLGEVAKKDGVTAVVGALNSLDAEAKEPWQKSLLKLSVSLVGELGPGGIDVFQGLVKQMLDGKSPDLSGLKVSEASDLLAAMQRREADTKNQIRLYVKLILETLGKALQDLVSAIFKEIKL
jgi:hypothetical protein